MRLLKQATRPQQGLIFMQRVHGWDFKEQPRRSWCLVPSGCTSCLVQLPQLFQLQVTSKAKGSPSSVGCGSWSCMALSHLYVPSWCHFSISIKYCSDQARTPARCDGLQAVVGSASWVSQKDQCRKDKMLWFILHGFYLSFWETLWFPRKKKKKTRFAKLFVQIHIQPLQNVA